MQRLINSWTQDEDRALLKWATHPQKNLREFKAFFRKMPVSKRHNLHAVKTHILLLLRDNTFGTTHGRIMPFWKLLLDSCRDVCRESSLRGKQMDEAAKPLIPWEEALELLKEAGVDPTFRTPVGIIREIRVYNKKNQENKIRYHTRRGRFLNASKAGFLRLIDTLPKELPDKETVRNQIREAEDKEALGMMDVTFTPITSGKGNGKAPMISMPLTSDEQKVLVLFRKHLNTVEFTPDLERKINNCLEVYMEEELYVLHKKVGEIIHCASDHIPPARVYALVSTRLDIPVLEFDVSKLNHSQCNTALEFLKTLTPTS